MAIKKRREEMRQIANQIEKARKQEEEYTGGMRITPVEQTRQTTLDDYGMKSSDEPYWTAQEWEEWAYTLLNNNGNSRMTPAEMLPEWFITAVKSE